MSQPTGVLLMAYGTPSNLDEVGPYLQSIRGGRVTSPEAVGELAERYQRVGGSTPLLKVTKGAAAALEKRLNGVGGAGYRVYVGMKHWYPFISEVVPRIAADGVQRLIAIPLAPHYSTMSTDGYRSALKEALQRLPKPVSVRFIESWHTSPLFIEVVAQKVQDGLRPFRPAGPADVEVLFSAHSLPARILQWDDPYPRELHQSAEAVARATGLPAWRFTYQSASHTGERWLGPDILETLSGLGSQGRKRVLMVPIGFVSDNLEILYDIDVEARELAEALGIELRRTDMLNASPAFIEVLADLVVNGTGARISDFSS